MRLCQHREVPPIPRRTIATLLGGTGLLAWALRSTPGDPMFLVATTILAVVWTGGAWAAGWPAPGAWPSRPDGVRNRTPAATTGWGILIGVALVALFLAGAVLVAPVPALSGPVDALLAHASRGPLGIVVVLTALTGFAEELFFRGALYDTLPNRHAALASTAVYTAVTAVSGVLLLVFAAALLGVVTALLRRHTGGALAPVATHVTWSVAMLLLLSPLLELLR